MKIEQIYTGCLSQGAYYIESEGEAAVIDPLREVAPYLERAKADGAQIKYVFETHFHADFVSGHLSLAKETGAPIVFGPLANPTFDALIAKDGQEFPLGKVKIKAIHTPGHTMESTTYLLLDENGKEHAIFSGDTLFLGDVGRPDLAQKSGTITKEQLAETLFDSLREKIMILPDEVIVYPAHGAGSACGKNMMKETVDTLGNQKAMNYALREDMTKAEFVKQVTDGLAEPPAYFPLNVKMNKEGYPSIEEVLKTGDVALSPADFESAVSGADAIVLDVRSKEEFCTSHIPRSIFIGLDGSFAPWVGALLKDVNQNILLVVPEGREQEAVTRLSRVGFDNTLGYLKGGVNAWIADGRETDSLRSTSAEAMQKMLDKSPDFPIIDVRKETEFQSQHVKSAQNYPLDKLNDFMDSVPADQDVYIHCASGYRSLIAASILKSRGVHNLIDVDGGFKAISETGLKTTAYVCPSEL